MHPESQRRTSPRVRRKRCLHRSKESFPDRPAHPDDVIDAQVSTRTHLFDMGTGPVLVVLPVKGGNRDHAQGEDEAGETENPASDSVPMPVDSARRCKCTETGRFPSCHQLAKVSCFRPLRRTPECLVYGARHLITSHALQRTAAENTGYRCTSWRVSAPDKGSLITVQKQVYVDAL